jgi:phosphoribosylformylglycinamidine synthase
MDYALEDFSEVHKTIMNDKTIARNYSNIYSKKSNYLEQVLQLEAVACKDWLTNKVDRCVVEKWPNNNVLDRYNCL